MRKVFNNKVLLFIVAILLVANVAMVCYFLWMREPAKRSFHGEQRQKTPITEFLQAEIGFSQAQMLAFDTIRRSHRQKMRPLFEDIKTAKVQFYQFLTNPDVNDSALNRAAAIIGEKQTLLDLQTFQNFKEIRTLCTPEQKARYDSQIVNEISQMWFPSWKGNGRPGKDSTKFRRP